ncbi:MAG: ABC transporter permease, partial [Maritimibacter sp.]
MKNIIPSLTVLAAIIAIWYGAAIKMNSTWTYDQAARAGTEPGFSEVVADTLAQDRPLLPAPHQVAVELWQTTVEKKITSKRSLVYHGWITLSA